MLAERILSVERSPFYSILELAAKRTDCVYLNNGEPDFDTPAHVVQAGQEAMAGGWTHYTPDRGHDCNVKPCLSSCSDEDLILEPIAHITFFLDLLG